MNRRSSHRLFTRYSVLIASISLACAGFALAYGSGSAAQGALAVENPTANIAIPSNGDPGVCTSAPTGSACEDAAVADLNNAHQQEGLAAYALPGDFTSLPSNEQLFVLVDLDRVAYGLTPVAGLNSTLDEDAQAAMESDSDPDFAQAQSLGISAGASNWAGGPQNVLFAYYLWMYDDGYGGDNGDCTTPSSSGCWGHRDNVLAFSGASNLAMGDAIGTDTGGRNSYALELVVTAASVPYEYTWTQALADGADGGAPPTQTAPLTTQAVTTTTVATVPQTTIETTPTPTPLVTTGSTVTTVATTTPVVPKKLAKKPRRKAPKRLPRKPPRKDLPSSKGGKQRSCKLRARKDCRRT